MDEALIDEIYECAFVPELWRSVLRRLGSVASTPIAWMFFVNDDHYRFVGSTSIVDAGIRPMLESGEIGRSSGFGGWSPRDTRAF